MKQHTRVHQFLAVVLFFIPAFMLAGTATTALCAGQIQWYAHDEGMAVGKSDEKKAFISFYADWCRYCREMENKTFKNPQIVSFLNDHFVSIRVDVEKERQIAAQYHINPLPDTWFISETGEVIGNKPGFMSAKELLPVLQFIHTESFLKMSFPEFLNDFENPAIK